MRIALCVIAAALMGLAPGRTYGQQALGDGRALDKNLRLGSGGINVAQPQRDYQGRNDVITGNVSGLGYFHGGVPYLAPGEFHGTLGSNRLFRFHATSLPVSVQRAGGQVGPVRAQRAMTALTAGDLRNAAPGTNMRRPRDAAAIGNRWSGYSDMESADPANPGGFSVGFVAKTDGGLLELNASPLLGVRAFERGANLRPRTIGRPLLAGEVLQTPNTPPDTHQAGSTLTDTTDQGATESNDVRLRSQVLPVRIEPRRLDGTNRTLAEQAQYRLLIPHVALHARPGQDVYRDLLWELDRSRRQQPDAPDSSGSAAPQPQSNQVRDDRPSRLAAPAAATDANGEPAK